MGQLGSSRDSFLPPLSLAQVRDLRVHLPPEGLPELAPAQARGDRGHAALPL